MTSESDKLTSYAPQEISKKWQKKWEDTKLYSPDMDRAQKPYYVLMMFPYPSAEGLHIGNFYAFTGVDSFARFKRMQGYDVFLPIGLDSFGIHSENYALKIGANPMDQSKIAEKNFYRQLEATANSYDWNRILETSDIDYYRWTQWLFIELFKAGLAYRKKSPVNFCPSCKTVLADEQVIDGKCERCGSVVEKRDLEQWFFRITDYAEPLLKNIPSLNWAEKVKTAQHNWIGKKEGATVSFMLSHKATSSAEVTPFAEASQSHISVFTTRPDTLYGVTALILSPEHPLIQDEGFMESVKDKIALSEYIKAHTNVALTPEEEAKKEKTGIDTGMKAIHPLTGEEIPVWVSDYVLIGFGTGAIMAVPAHDERDMAFAKKFGIPVKYVIDPVLVRDDAKSKKEFHKKRKIVAVLERENGDVLTINWGPKMGGRLFVGGTIDGKESPEETAIREVTEESGYNDIEVLYSASETFHYKYFAFSKNEAHDAEVSFVYLRLKSEAKQEQNLDESEKNNFKVEWVSKDFAEKEVVEPLHKYGFDRLVREDAYEGPGVIANSEGWNGLSYFTPVGREKIFSDLVAKNAGERQVNYHLRDWLISRQRYWGPPIPMIYCESCAKTGKSWFSTHEEKKTEGWETAGWYPEEKLPVELPYIEDYRPIGTGESPLGNHPEFYEATCPGCGETARRETDVSDTFLDSAWYFFRYMSTEREDVPFDEKRVAHWLPTSIYIGGAEHSVLHLLYARFITHFLKDIGRIDFDEPFSWFFANGLIIKDGAKMSKSKGNVILPDPLIEKFGIDTVRMYLRFIGPFSEGGDFRDTGIEGMHRFVKRIWTLFTDVKQQETMSKEAQHMMHKTIKGVTEDMEALRFNTAIAKLMEWYNFLAKEQQIDKESAMVFLKLLAPFAPHMTEELWERIGEPYSIHKSTWPVWDEKYLTTESVTVVVQINGKLRDSLTLDAHDSALSDKAEMEEKAKACPNVQKHLEGKDIKQVIYVPKRIVNFVI